VFDRAREKPLLFVAIGCVLTVGLGLPLTVGTALSASLRPTVMFVDIRDLTPFAEANTAEDTVARLNALLEIVVPAVVEAGGHIPGATGAAAVGMARRQGHK